uniref:GP3 protein n=1 Tax=Mikumi yellow baboon virus 1 TaxID=1546177 RepID=A0A089G091_9NIDO|nr:GP3 protein [Mikumi yellow baboon virus 1]
MYKAPLPNCRARVSPILCSPAKLLVHIFSACLLSLLVGVGGTEGSGSNSSCFLFNSTDFLLVGVGRSRTQVNLTRDRSDIIGHLCTICNCSVAPCSCSHASMDLAWVTTHPLQHLLLFLTALLPNQFHLRRPRTVHA